MSAYQYSMLCECFTCETLIQLNSVNKYLQTTVTYHATPCHQQTSNYTLQRSGTVHDMFRGNLLESPYYTYIKWTHVILMEVLH